MRRHSKGPCHERFHRNFNSLRRSKILIKAARFGLATYRRERDLKRLLRASRVPAAGSGLGSLISIEAELESSRKVGDTTYKVSRHVEILTAMIAEASLLPRQKSA